MLWENGVQLNSTIGGKAATIASMIGVNKSSSARSPRPVGEQERVVIAAGRPAASATDGQRVRVGFPKPYNGSATERSAVPHSAQHAVQQRAHQIVQQPTSRGVPRPQPLEQSARVAGSWAISNTSITDTAIRPWLHDAGRDAAACRHTRIPVACTIN